MPAASQKLLTVSYWPAAAASRLRHGGLRLPSQSRSFTPVWPPAHISLVCHYAAIFAMKPAGFVGHYCHARFYGRRVRAIGRHELGYHSYWLLISRFSLPFYGRLWAATPVCRWILYLYASLPRLTPPAPCLPFIRHLLSLNSHYAMKSPPK